MGTLFPRKHSLKSILLTAGVAFIWSSLDSFAQNFDDPNFDLLKSMGEPSLVEASKDPTIQFYRLLSIESFTPSFLVKLQIKPGGEGLLRVVRFVSLHSNTLRTSSSAVSKAEVSRFLTLVKANQFWEIPPTIDRVNGEDGFTWTLDGLKNGKAHSISRWCPKKDSPTYQLGLAFKKMGQEQMELTSFSDP